MNCAPNTYAPPRPVVGDTYRDRSGLQVECRAISQTHVVCSGEHCFTRQEFSTRFHPVSAPTTDLGGC